MKMMRIPEVWTTNLVALLFGYGMYVMFTIVPQFVETSTKYAYGLGASVTQSGLDLLPFAAAMLFIAPLTGKLSAASGRTPGPAGRLPVRRQRLRRAGVLARPDLADHGLGAGCWASGSPWASPPCPTWWSRRCRQSQTGVATGMNTNIRNIGGAVGAGVATSIVVSSLLPDGTPSLHGYVLAFVVSAAALLIAAVTTLAHPPARGRPGPPPGLIIEADAGITPASAAVIDVD